MFASLTKNYMFKVKISMKYYRSCAVHKFRQYSYVYYSSLNFSNLVTLTLWWFYVHTYCLNTITIHGIKNEKKTTTRWHIRVIAFNCRIWPIGRSLNDIRTGSVKGRWRCDEPRTGRRRQKVHKSRWRTTLNSTREIESAGRAFYYYTKCRDFDYKTTVK